MVRQYRLDELYQNIATGIEEWCSEGEECALGRGRLGTVRENWEDDILKVMAVYTEQVVPKWQDAARLQALEREVLLLQDRCAELERTAPVVVQIQTLAPEPYEVVKPINVVVRFDDEQYIAMFLEANISASGDTEVEAIFNVKDLLIAANEMFEGMDENKLGTGPLQQKQVLKEFIQRKG